MVASAFTWPDAWVFTALSLTHKTGDQLNLKDIIAAGDMLNHAIFNKDEIITGFEKLQTNGVIRFDGLKIMFTETGAEIIKKSEKTPGGLFARIEITEKKLNSKRNKFSEGVADKGIETYIKKNYRSACKEYTKSV